jgi:hypothetical protein
MPLAPCSFAVPGCRGRPIVTRAPRAPRQLVSKGWKGTMVGDLSMKTTSGTVRLRCVWTYLVPKKMDH